MKKCPQCAEEVQDAAKACRFCGHTFELSRASKENRIGCAVVLVAALVFISMTTSEDSTPPPARASLSSQQVEDCTRLLKDGEQSGLIRQRPEFNRINVDDGEWAAFPASAKKGVLLALGCEAFGGRPLNVGDYVVAYGYRSGKRVAILTSVGINYD